VIFLSIPYVQTSLGKYATKRLNKEFGTNINIGKVGLQFNGDVELKDILIVDYKNDTLIHLNELNTSIISFKNLYNNKFTFGDIDVEGLTFNIKTYFGESDTNLDIFVAKFEDENPREEASTFVLSSTEVSIENGIFRLIDENKEIPKKLEFSKLNIHVNDFLIKGPDVRMKVNSLAFHDSRGVEVTEMSTDFDYTLEGMTFNDLDIKTTESELIGKIEFSYSREDLQYFTDRVNIKANFKNSTVSFNELNMFYNEFGPKEIAHLNADLSGTLNDLQIDSLDVHTSRYTVMYWENQYLHLLIS